MSKKSDRGGGQGSRAAPNAMFRVQMENATRCWPTCRQDADEPHRILPGQGHDGAVSLRLTAVASPTDSSRRCPVCLAIPPLPGRVRGHLPHESADDIAKAQTGFLARSIHVDSLASSSDMRSLCPR